LAPPSIKSGGSTGFDDRHGGYRVSNGGDPVCDLVGVGHGRRQAHEANMVREVDDHFLPYRSSVRVLEKVHFVENDETQSLESLGSAVDHVAEHFGGHHHHGGIRVDAVVSRQ